MLSRVIRCELSSLASKQFEVERGMFKPKIGISMLHTLAEPFNVMLKHMAKVETEYVEIVDDGFHTLNKRRVGALKGIAKTRGFKYSLHCPFADINIASPSKPMLNASMKRLKQSMAFAAELRAELWVLHPGQKTGISPFYPDLDWKQQARSLLQLHETATKLGLCIAIENVPGRYGALMKTTEDFRRFYNETGLTDVGIVLDTGHANLENQIQPFLQQFPNRIAHLHLSDNMGEIDEHLGIGSGKIDWQQLATQLKNMRFNGIVMIESVFNVPESLVRLQQLFA
jgi:sugar phosphate isomerase/epimerase